MLEAAARQIEEILGRVESATKQRIERISLEEIDVTNIGGPREHLMTVRIDLEREPAKRIWAQPASAR